MHTNEENYKTWSMGDWEWALNLWDEASEQIWSSGVVRYEDTLIELVEERYASGDKKGRVLVEQLWMDVCVACLRLKCDGPARIVWNDDDQK